jgi:hypothetical protein
LTDERLQRGDLIGHGGHVSRSGLVRNPHPNPDYPAQGIIRVIRRQSVYPQGDEGRREFVQQNQGFPSLPAVRCGCVPPAGQRVLLGYIPCPGKGERPIVLPGGIGFPVRREFNSDGGPGLFPRRGRNASQGGKRGFRKKGAYEGFFCRIFPATGDRNGIYRRSFSQTAGTKEEDAKEGKKEG